MGRPFGRASKHVCWLSRAAAQQQKLLQGRRQIQISTTPNGASPAIGKYSPGLPDTNNAESPDAKFEVLGAPYSLLSASLSASQILYTQRGTLVGVSGKAENAISTLSMLEPFRRTLLGIPFLYQKISSASPLTALIATRSPITSFAVVHLNGTIDWIVAQRRALLAWTGHTLTITPTINRRMSLAHWGNSHVTGRGLLALVGKGQIYEVVLRDGEEYLAHPSNVVAYTATQHPPLPYRLRSSALRLQIPGIKLGTILPDTKFFRVMQQSDTWKAVTNFFFTLRTWSRRTIWGDRLFLQFRGPITILLQTRASRLNDVLTNRDVNEISDTPAGVAQEAVVSARNRPPGGEAEGLKASMHSPAKPARLSVATIGSDGKVKFEETGDFKSLSN